MCYNTKVKSLCIQNEIIVKSERSIFMKVAVIGSRGITLDDITPYLPEGTTEIVTGGARGVDACAEKYAREHGLALTVFRPRYDRFGRGAPMERNRRIVEYADCVVAIWDGDSRGTEFVIRACRDTGKPVSVYIVA